MAKRPLFAAGLFSFATALLCAHTSFTMIVVLTAVAAIVLTISLILCRLPLMTAVMFCAVGMLAASGLFLIKQCTVVYPQLTYAGDTACVTMDVKEELPSGQGYIVTASSGEIQEGTRLCLRIFRADITPSAGDRITATVTLRAAFENDTFQDADYAKANDVYLFATLVPNTDIVWDTDCDTLTVPQRMIVKAREYIRKTLYDHMDFDNAALCEGVLLGYRDRIDPSVERSFRVSGIYHLLAVSGQHLSMLVGVLFWILDRAHIRRRRGALIGMVIAVAFAALCGFSASVTRACAMTVLMLVGHLFRRRPDGLNSLGFAAFVMIAVDPFVIYDVGFQLSVAATLGIVMLFPTWHEEVSKPLAENIPIFGKPLGAVSSSIGLTLAATLFTQPITAMYFKELSLVFLPANVVCLPLSSVLLVLCLLFTVAELCIPFLSIPCVWGMQQLCDGMTGTASFLASLPFAAVGANMTFVAVWTVLLAILIPVGYTLYKMRGVALTAFGMVLVLFPAMLFHNVLYRDVTAVIPVSSSSPTVLIHTRTSNGLIFHGDSDAMMRTASVLQAENIDHLDWVLWMNSPRTTVNTEALQVSIDQLVVLHDEARYATLPAAETVKTLKKNGKISFDNDKTIVQCDGIYRISMGDTSMLMLPKNCNLRSLPPSWRDADFLLMEGEAPDGCERLNAQQVLVYCPYQAIDTTLLSIPRTFENVYMLGRDDIPVFLTRGEGDITLRSY